MSYNQKPPGAGGSGPPNGPNNQQQVAKTLAGIQQQMQNLVHGQNVLPQAAQADLNAFLQNQRFQNMFKQQQQQQMMQQHFQQQMQQKQQQQNKDRPMGNSGSSGGVGVSAVAGGGEPLALTRAPTAAAELINKTYQQHQQQPNGGSASATPNPGLNQFPQQLPVMPPNIMQQLQAQISTAFHMQHIQQQQQQPQPTSGANLPVSHQSQQQQQQQQQQNAINTAVQQFQQSLQQHYLSAAAQATSGSKLGTTPPVAAPPLTNQLKHPNLPPSTQITAVPAVVPSLASSSSKIPTVAEVVAVVAAAAKQKPPPTSIKTYAASSAQQLNKQGANVGAVPSPFPAHFQKQSVTIPTSNTSVTLAASPMKVSSNLETTAITAASNPSLMNTVSSTKSQILSEATTPPRKPIVQANSSSPALQNTNQTSPQKNATSPSTPIAAKNLKPYLVAETLAVSHQQENRTIGSSKVATAAVQPLKDVDISKKPIETKEASEVVAVIDKEGETKNQKLVETLATFNIGNEEITATVKGIAADVGTTQEIKSNKTEKSSPLSSIKEDSKAAEETKRNIASKSETEKVNEVKRDEKVESKYIPLSPVNVVERDESVCAAGKTNINSMEERSTNILKPLLSASKLTDEIVTETTTKEGKIGSSIVNKSVLIESNVLNQETGVKEAEVENFKNEKPKVASNSLEEGQTPIPATTESCESKAVTPTPTGCKAKATTSPVVVSAKKPGRQPKAATTAVVASTAAVTSAAAGISASAVISASAKEKRANDKTEKASSSRNSRKTKTELNLSIEAAVSLPAQTPKKEVSDRKSQRHRLKTILYQSPLPELAFITKLSASEASNSPKPMTGDDKLIVFYKNEYMAVRNAEGNFYLCQTMQNVYRTSPRISIRWLSEDAEDGNVYKPDFYDHTDIECVLTTVELRRVDKGHLRLPKTEKARIESILKKAIDVEKGVAPRPELSEENPDGLDISLYKDESQIEKKSSSGFTTSGRKRVSGSGSGGCSNTEAAESIVKTTPTTPLRRGRKRKESVAHGANGSSARKVLGKKRKTLKKRKNKTNGTTSDSDDSELDAEYKPTQKHTNKNSANTTLTKPTPRAQRSPLAKARAASPITPAIGNTATTSKATKVAALKVTVAATPLTTVGRGERATKRKSAGDVNENVSSTTPTPAKRTELQKEQAGEAAATTATNTSKANNAKSKENAVEVLPLANAAVNSLPSTSAAAAAAATTTASNSVVGVVGNNRTTRNRK